MSQEQTSASSRSAVAMADESQSVYGHLFGKINLSPVAQLTGIEYFQSAEALADASADERVTAAVSVFLNLLKKSSQKLSASIKRFWMNTLLHWMRKLAVNWMLSCTILISSALSRRGGE